MPLLKKYRRELFLITFGVALFAALDHLDRVMEGAHWLLGIVSPIWVGAVIALLLNVPMRGLERLLHALDRRQRMPEKAHSLLCLALTIVVVLLVVVLAVRLLLPQLIDALTGLLNLITSHRDTLTSLAESVGISADRVTGVLNDVTGWLAQNISNVTTAALSTLGSVFSSTATLIMSVMLAIYILANKPQLKRQARSVLDAYVAPGFSHSARRVFGMFVETFSKFLSYQCIEAVILGVLLLGGMLAFGLPCAVQQSCLTAVMALIPYVGAYLSFAVGAVTIALVDPSQAVIFMVVFLCAQQIEGNVIYPRVVGTSVGLPSYITLSAVFVGGALGGIAGVFFVIPIASVVYTLVRESIARRKAAAPQPPQEEPAG